MAAACLTRSSWSVAADEAAVPAWLRQEEGVHPTSSTVAFCVGRRGCRPPPGLWHRREPRPAFASPVAATRERWQQSAVNAPGGWEGPFDLRRPRQPRTTSPKRVPGSPGGGRPWPHARLTLVAQSGATLAEVMRRAGHPDAEEARNTLRRDGMGINDPQNGVFLPGCVAGGDLQGGEHCGGACRT